MWCKKCGNDLTAEDKDMSMELFKIQTSCIECNNVTILKSTIEGENEMKEITSRIP